MTSDIAVSSSPKRSGAASCVATALIVLALVGFGLRIASRTGSLGELWDEPIMVPVIDAIVHDGWTVEHAVDYEDTKGPAFFWLYAGLAEIFGSDISRLRLFTVILFVLTAIPLGWITARCGLTPRQSALFAALYALLPYNTVLGQLFMSEPSFLLGCALLLCAFLWGFGSGRGDAHPLAGPIAFSVLLSLLLHHRPHVVVFAGAAVLIAFERDRWKCWPWVLACIAAGLSRLPLYLHWGGLVSPQYQYRLGLGVRLDSLTYIAISLLPLTFVMLWPIVFDGTYRFARRWILLGAIAGLLLGIFATPDLSLTVEGGQERYQGIVATAMRAFVAQVSNLPAPLDGFGSPGGLSLVFAVLGALGVAALVATLVPTMRGSIHEPAIVIRRGAGWIILAGWLLYGVTRGSVFDRYLLPFEMLLPLLWIRFVPRWLLGIQAVLLLGMLGYLLFRWGLL